jgi:hypothetical protein
MKATSKVFAALVFSCFLGSATAGYAQCAGNLPPRAHDNVYTMNANTNISIFFNDVKANDVDPEGATLSAFPDGGPSQGSFCGIAPNGICFRPPAGFTGLIVIPFVVSDPCHTVAQDVLILVR